PVPEVSFRHGAPYAGDLISISNRDDFPIEKGDVWETEWKTVQEIERRPLPNQPETEFGRPSVSTNRAALSNKSVWVIGDSFTNQIVPFLESTFKEVSLLGHANQKLQTLPDDLRNTEEHPDLVIIVSVERSF
ncbi:MAG: hypothetical protein HRU32_09700, partial [Rhodobacteraceae bacterium]|nr:hypothetical protein [Paracoccaceae bacterium]